MSPQATLDLLFGQCAPRVSGDEPYAHLNCEVFQLCSPRERG